MSKLYTEEQLRDAIAFGNISRPNITNDDWIKRQTPIELPTYEEIAKKSEWLDNPLERINFKDGAKWVVNKIKGGTNENIF